MNEQLANKRVHLFSLYSHVPSQRFQFFQSWMHGSTKGSTHDSKKNILTLTSLDISNSIPQESLQKSCTKQGLPLIPLTFYVLLILAPQHTCS